jgi:O-acetyl-ADP-ribose deacetylase (regulator of RNase III)
VSTYSANHVVLTLTQGNIVDMHVDAIVNAANASLAGGGGVDGAIHRAAGPTIMQECRAIGGCETGSAVATSAGRLDAKYIFHAVGPIYRGTKEDAESLANAYKSCLALADQYQLQSIAFPSLSTGAYGYPVKLAAPLALRTVMDHMRQGTSLRQITFVLFDRGTYDAYVHALSELSTNR